MHVQRFSGPLLALLAALFTACSGSGSSGFTQGSRVSEDAVIQQVIAGQQVGCLERTDLQICYLPAISSGPTPTTPPSPPPIQMRIDILSDVSQLVADCSEFSSTEPDCQFPLAFIARGFSADATFLIATRTADPQGPWRIGPDRGNTRVSTQIELTAVVRTDSFSDTSLAIDVAILVFVGQSPPSLDPTINELADSGADLAFVNALIIDRTLN
jgi:hypothetical protein